MKDGVLVARAKYCNSQERVLPPPSIRVYVSAGLNKKEIERSANVLRDSIKRVVHNKK